VGGALMRHAIARADERGCRIVQLTTDKTRADAKRFYERLGFRLTHEGMKLHLPRPDL
jgi:ribosomal protein S18 acetylase RimI-like enzyme